MSTVTRWLNMRNPAIENDIKSYLTEMIKEDIANYMGQSMEKDVEQVINKYFIFWGLCDVFIFLKLVICTFPNQNVNLYPIFYSFFFRHPSKFYFYFPQSWVNPGLELWLNTSNTSKIWHHCMWVLSCVWLFETLDCSPPGSSVHGILHARILQWVAISYSRGSSWSRDQTHISCVSCIGR